MKKIVLFAVVAAFAAFGFTSTASAGSCTVGATNIYYDSGFLWSKPALSCTNGVYGAEFANSGAQPGTTGFYDQVSQVLRQATYGAGGVINGSYYYYYGLMGVATWGCVNPPGRSVTIWYKFRIKSTPSSWGPWHQVSNIAQQTIWC